MTTTDALPAEPLEPAPENPFRWRLERRPDLRFGHAAGGVAGILVAAAVVAFIVEVTDEDATLPGVGFNVLLIAAALVAGYLVRGPVRSAAVAALLFAIPQVWLFAIIGDAEGVDRGDFRIILLLSVATYVLFYALTWTRGRAVLLGVALLLFTNWIVFEVADQPTPLGVAPVADTPVGFAQEFGGSGDNLTESGVVELLMAAVLLGGAVALDRRGRAGAATPLLVVGGVQAVAAASTLGADVENVYAVGIFVALAGLAIGLAGSLGRRRGTSYVGAAILLVGALVVVGKGTSDSASGDGSAAVFGAFALAAGAALLLIGVLVAGATHEPLDGGEPVPEEPPPPDPEPAPALVGAPTAETSQSATAETPAPETSAAETPEPEATADQPADTTDPTPPGEPWSRPDPDA